MKQKNRIVGFTLIELLVTIAIIAALAVVIFSAINPGKRVNDSKAAQTEVGRQSIMKAVNYKLVDSLNNFADPSCGAGQVPTTPVLIASSVYNIAPCLTEYFKKIPINSVDGGYYNAANDYDTAFLIARNPATNLVSVRRFTTIASDTFAGTVMNTTFWKEYDPAGIGGTAGNVQQNEAITIANSYQGGVWGKSAYYSKDTIESGSLEISATITPISDALLGYGDYNFQSTGTSAYIFDIQTGGNLLALAWDNGVFQGSASCGSSATTKTYKMKIITTGFEIYQNGTLICTLTTGLGLDNKKVFFESSAAASTFDDLLIYGYGNQIISTVPAQVPGVVATGTNNQALLDWDTPSGTTITDYIVEYKTSAGSTWSTFTDGISSATKAIVTGLTNGTSYDFRISAVNPIGTGTASNIVSAQPKNISTLAFVFTGESNSGGIGANTDATGPEIAPRSSVQIMNLTSGNFLFENLDIGINNLRDHAGLSGYYATSHGFELELANLTEASAFTGLSQVYLVKTGQGGSLVSEWNIGSTYWTKYLQRTAAAKSQLPGTTQWVVWLSLGINDAISGTSVSTWKTAMIAHINKIKADLPDAIFIMTEFQSMPVGSGYPAYNTAIDEIAASEANVFSVNSTGAGTDGANHWSYAGLKTVGALMGTATKNALGI